MILTSKIKLIPNRTQYNQLKETMKIFNLACNKISEIAFDEKCFSKVKIQQICYYQIKDEFLLSSQMVIRAIAKVCESYKVNKDSLHTFKETGAVVYDQRNLSFKGIEIASISSLDGRIEVPMIISSYHKGYMEGKRVKGQAELVISEGIFYLLLAVEFPEDTPIKTEDFLGIDLGIVNIATDSTGEKFSGSKLNSLRLRYKKIRSKLQSKGTKSAKRLLKSRSKKEARMVADANHVISKQLVEKAKRHNLSIALEDLNGISKKKTKKKTVIKALRTQLSNWSFYQLQLFIQYKAQLLGVPVIFVKPYYTSQECSCCGYTEKENRVSQSKFICKSCGFSANADYNASLNIRRRANVK
ncbi:RNA-guided endonuclease InsQ/TnpB family protein [Cetobacterium somerae]|uniref:RNA-guided endonuclease InsQ/TnpB family protein n=1 Tax=Cetobacterium somerae TaxID=188913 RepID=UPI003D768577